MGLPPDLTLLEMVREWRRRSKETPLLPPSLVDSGPVMENVMTGEEVDLLVILGYGIGSRFTLILCGSLKPGEGGGERCAEGTL